MDFFGFQRIINWIIGQNIKPVNPSFSWLDCWWVFPFLDIRKQVFIICSHWQMQLRPGIEGPIINFAVSEVHFSAIDKMHFIFKLLIQPKQSCFRVFALLLLTEYIKVLVNCGTDWLYTNLIWVKASKDGFIFKTAGWSTSKQWKSYWSEGKNRKKISPSDHPLLRKCHASNFA